MSLEQEASQARELERIRRAQGWLRAAEKAYAVATSNQERRVSRILEHACLKFLNEGNHHWLRALPMMKRYPVTIEEFLDSNDFLNGADPDNSILHVWPTLRQDVLDMNPDIMTGAPNVHQVLAGGATGTGKTETAKASLLYRAYFLTCFESPQRLFYLSPSTMLVFMFQNVQISVTKRVQYDPFRQNFLAMPYTRRYLRWDKHKEASLIFPEQNIEITMGLPTVQAMVGAAIVGAHQDEVNFLQVVENSKQVAGPTGQGGFFDQAEVAFRNITRRRKRSTATQGPDPSLICVSSSTRYKEDFLDRRMAEARKNDEVGVGEGKGVLIFRHKQYEIQPSHKYSGKKMRVLVGSDTYATRILEDHEVAGEHYPAGAEVEEVPVEFKADFQSDPEGSLRDVIGVSSNALKPFITQRHKLVEAVVRFRSRRLKEWVAKSDVDLLTDGMPQYVEGNMPPRAERAATPRYIHVDLSKKKDRCGVAVVRVDGHKPMFDEATGITEYAPKFVVEMAVTIKPSQAAELDIGEVRTWLMQLATFYGFNIAAVSYDGFQSSESMMMWRKAGIPSNLVSTDVSTEVYDHFKRALYQDRIDMIESEIARFEFSNLELNEKAEKIDHPPKGSKDISDAIASAIFNAGRSRDVRDRSRVTVQVAKTLEDGTTEMQEVGTSPNRRRIQRRRTS